MNSLFKRRKARQRTAQRGPWGKIAPYALICLVSFLCGVGLLLLMLAKAERLVALGLAGALYYIVLLPLGLAAAGFLFGVFRSYASYKGKHLGGALELGGPVVAFAMVVLGGFVLVPSTATFALTVYVHGEAGPQDVVLKDSGFVLLDLGPDRRREPIGPQGQVYFPAVPADFRGQEVPVGLESDDFEPAAPVAKARLDGPSVYLPVRKKPGEIVGCVHDDRGNPIPHASVEVAGVSASTNNQGHFKLDIPGDLRKDEMPLQATAPGYQPAQYQAVPNSNEMSVLLTRAVTP